jgi:MFS family permease
MTKNALLISLSAFFSDMGYQAVLAVLPLFIVITLHAPVYIYGIIMGISYGLGSLLGYIGGKLSDKYGKKKISIIGNLLIPILSLTGIATSVIEAASFFTTGWLFRNFRSPARKALISEETNSSNRGRIFGFLNALDVGGGAISITVLISLLYLGVNLGLIILLTSIPILFATILLIFVKERKKDLKDKVTSKVVEGKIENVPNRAYMGVLLATALYGFSAYSLGFPILTIAQTYGSDLLGLFSYLLFLFASALFGYFIGSRKLRLISSLGYLGYLLSAVGTFLLAISYFYHLSILVMYLGVLIVGMAIGTIDSLEPNLITQVKPNEKRGGGMGSLTASRSFGLFMGNIIMGLLYYFNPAYSYAYAGVAALIAGIIILVMGLEFKNMI